MYVQSASIVTVNVYFESNIHFYTDCIQSCIDLAIRKKNLEMFRTCCIGGSRERGYGGCNPLSNFKIKGGNKTKQKLEDNPLEKEEERKSCMFV